MASRGIEMLLALVLQGVMVWHVATAQSNCSSTLLGLSPCLNYVTGNTSTPSQSCCTQLGNVVQSSPRCLCALMNGAGASMSITINQTLALALPGACNVQTPPFSQCNAAIPPATSPATSPTPSSSGDASDEVPAAEPTTTTPNPTIPSGSGTGTASKTVPTTNGNTSDGNLTKPFLILFLIALASTAIHF